MNVVVLVASLATATMASADTADDDFRVATRQFSRQRWAPAANELAAFLTNHPDDARTPDARYLLGESFVQLRRYQEARQHLNTFLRLTSQHRYRPQAEFRAAEAAYHTADHQAAKRDFEAYRKRYPDDPLTSYALAYLGEIALNAGDGQQAAAMFVAATTGEPHERLAAQCRFGLAQAHELQNNIDESLKLYGQTVEAANKYSPHARFRLAMLRYRRGEFALAESQLTQLAQTANDELLFETQYWLGMTHLGQENWSAAISVLREGLDAAPRHRLTHARKFALGEALRKDGRVDAAREKYTRLFNADPACDWSDDAGQILVQMAWEAGDLETVQAAARRFHQRHPDSPLAIKVQQQQGRAFLKQQEFAAAVDIFEGLVESALASGATVSANHYYLAIAYLGADRPADVLRVLPAVEATSDDSELNNGLRVVRATALIALKRYEQAIKPLEAYLAEHATGADSVDCHARLVLSLAETGQWYAAAESFEWFRQRHPDSPRLLKTARYLADLALAERAHDIADPLFRFLAGDALVPDADDAVDRAAVVDAAAVSEPLPSGNAVQDQESKVVQVEPAATRATPYHVFHGLIGLSRSQFAREMFAEAIRTTGRLQSLSPPPILAADAWLLQARAHEARDELLEALECYRQIFEFDPMCETSAPALYAAARILTQQGDQNAAIELLGQLARQHAAFDHRDGTLYQLAWLLKETGQLAQAEVRFEQLVREHQQSPLWADAVFRLARSAANRRDVAGANRWLDELLYGVDRETGRDRATPGTERSKPGAGQADKVTQIVCHALYLQGKLAVDASDWLGALRSYHRIVEEYPESALAAAAWFWSAESYFHLGHYDQADTMLSQQPARATGAAEEFEAMIPLRRAQIAAHRQQWPEALALVENIARRHPKFSLQFEADYLIGRCLSTQARFSMARQYFRQVINSPAARRTETAAMAQWMIGETYFHQTKYAEAIRAYYRVDALYDQPQWQAAALLQAAKCHELSDQWQEAQQLYFQLRNEFSQTTYAAEAIRRLRVATRTRTE